MRIASSHPAALLFPPTTAPDVEVRRARPTVSPALFARVVDQRTHDLAALGVASLLVGVLVALGVWMTIEVGEALSIAQYCDGKCVGAP